MNILWHLRPQYDSLVLSGANLRLLNLIRELEAQGRRVYLLLDDFSSSDDHCRDSFVKKIQDSLPVTGICYFNCTSSYNETRARVFHKLVYPPLINVFLGKHYLQMADQLVELIDEYDIDVFITSMRCRLWLLPYLKGRVVTAIDWCDSDILAAGRELQYRVTEGKIQGIPAVLKTLTLAIAQERYYGRVVDLNLLASPADEACLNRFACAPEKTHVIFNGISPASSPARRIPKRLIFTGNMSFPPNHQSALWFIDYVLPLIIDRDPAIKLVIAGADPPPELSARESNNISVIGFVEDMGREISASQLYVVPMVTGSGFKNKVTEAIVNGTFVVGTTLAFEFLDQDIRDLLLVGDTPLELANQILTFFENPQAFEDRMTLLQQLMSRRFQWATQARKLIHLLDEAATDKH